MEKALIIPDCHIPFHDEVAYKTMLKIGKALDPDEIVILGDFVDFYAVTHWKKDPSVLKEFGDVASFVKTEFEEGRKKLRQLRRMFPKAKIVFIEGNHEHRLSRYIMNNAPALYGLVTVENALGIDEYCDVFVPYGRMQRYPVLGTKLIARHEPTAGGKHAARCSLDKSMESMVFGHGHKVDEATKNSGGGRLYRAFEPGWLGNVKAPVFNYVANTPDWSHGVGVVYRLPNSNFFHYTVNIMEGNAVFGGKLIKS